jgi:Response regulator receiver domain
MVPFAAAFVCPSMPVLDPAAATILVVEDEPTVCELAAEALMDEGYRVLTAADAWQAEAILAAESVDMLFTDIDLARNTNGLARGLHLGRSRRARALRGRAGIGVRPEALPASPTHHAHPRRPRRRAPPTRLIRIRGLTPCGEAFPQPPLPSQSRCSLHRPRPPAT